MQLLFGSACSGAGKKKRAPHVRRGSTQPSTAMVASAPPGARMPKVMPMEKGPREGLFPWCGRTPIHRAARRQRPGAHPGRAGRANRLRPAKASAAWSRWGPLARPVPRAGEQRQGPCPSTCLLGSSGAPAVEINVSLVPRRKITIRPARAHCAHNGIFSRRTPVCRHGKTRGRCQRPGSMRAGAVGAPRGLHWAFPTSRAHNAPTRPAP